MPWIWLLPTVLAIEQKSSILVRVRSSSNSLSNELKRTTISGIPSKPNRTSSQKILVRSNVSREFIFYKNGNYCGQLEPYSLNPNEPEPWRVGSWPTLTVVVVVVGLVLFEIIHHSWTKEPNRTERERKIQHANRECCFEWVVFHWKPSKPRLLITFSCLFDGRFAFFETKNYFSTEKQRSFCLIGYACLSKNIKLFFFFNFGFRTKRIARSMYRIHIYSSLHSFSVYSVHFTHSALYYSWHISNVCMPGHGFGFHVWTLN